MQIIKKLYNTTGIRVLNNRNGENMIKKMMVFFSVIVFTSKPLASGKPTNVTAEKTDIKSSQVEATSPIAIVKKHRHQYSEAQIRKYNYTTYYPTTQTESAKRELACKKLTR